MHYQSKVFTTYPQELEKRLNKVLLDVSEEDRELVDVKLTPINTSDSIDSEMLLVVVISR
ncbi:hypothetical protein MK904_04440 [Loigolactobacillus coryniformis]|jgi:hypothetical protein|uniref:Sporulation protein Cse60 n=3 Tax=Loigolactobacillus coryniformis TaxID=1610 RepID=A0A0R1F6Q1_9LACO|nr:hypothetical protein [Loigolactobacillus coryniformis]MDT3392174.1 hypothetical protein [Bacillota bacterium]OEH89954.1 hypothetical protein ATO00_07725 [Loigolactobacillus coryniformis subsp. coryniformis]RRG05447.1 MAG: hypothetical protein DUD28_06165 [Lactobacillus sp.]ATO44175.1 hypothetical protein LC20004_09820 [Loigolactobacillus coryniformis subsp. torquens DSM 20004 = KCTC 3535]ATO55841.1 hypothetical protein LC20001_09470 [Loigolactobacillus coryniformis subsp. coryniformis KCTC 